MADNEYKKLYFDLSAELAKATETLTRAMQASQEAYESINAASAATTKDDEVTE